MLKLQKRARWTAGFSLIELMVVVLIAGILIAIAVPSYSARIREARRTDAKSALLDLAGREERYFNGQNNTYTNLAVNLGYAASGSTATLTSYPIGGGYYTVTVTVAAATATVPATYTITATTAGTQSADAACATLSVNNLGQQTATGTDPNPNVNCWK